MLAKGLCSACYARSRRPNPPTGPIRGYNVVPPERDRFVPTRVPGVRQFATAKFPLEECPHCHGSFLEYDGREAHCAGVYGGCGQTVYLVTMNGGAQ